MILQIFRPPNDGETLMECKLGDINDAISLQYEKYFCGVGSFTLELPINSPFADKIAANILLYDKQNDDCFIVKNVQDDTKVLRVTGTDLNGILRDRIILPTADAEVSDGKVIVYGSTEYCVKYFVERNFICADANERNVPRLGISDNLNRGLEYDTYLASPENAEDVIRTMCEGAKLGYRVRLDVNQTSSEQPVLIFDVSEREDHTAEQDERNRVIFSVGLGNVGTMEREVGITAEKNALWCDTGGAEVFVNKEDGEPPAGWARREEYVSLSVVNPDDGDEVTGAARQVMADKFAVTDSLKIKAGNPLEYGSVYKLGDIVTVYDKAKKAQLDTWISAVAISRKSNENTLSITLGESKPKLLDKYARQTDILKKNQRDFPTVKYIGAGTLTEYNVLSDTSVKYNGTTYTAELADSGLISKITDDQGAEFSPTFADGVTDITLHNATFLAVAMISGLKPPTSGWVLTDLIHQNTEVVTEPKSFNTNLGTAPDEFTIEVCMRFYGVGNTSSNQACTVFHVGVTIGDNNNLRLATCDYHSEAYTYLWGGSWADYESNQDYTTFPSHKGELATSTLVIKKTSDSSSEVKVYSNGELRDTNVTGWQGLNLSEYVLLDNKSFERKALGTIYQVRIYSRALTDAEVAQNASEDRRCYG